MNNELQNSTNTALTLNDILSLFSFDFIKWSNLDAKYQKNEKNGKTLEGDHFKVFYTCNKDKIPKIQNVLNFPNSYISGHQLSPINNNQNDISVLVKQAKEDEIIREVIASQILNYYNCETAFYFGTIGSKLNPYNSISIDFISPDENFYTLQNLDFYDIWEIKDSIAEFNPNCRTSINPMPIILQNASIKQRENLIRSFVRSYMVRTILLRDSDHTNYNQGILINPKKKIYSFINFDYENAFSEGNLENEHRLSLKYIFNEYPDIYNEIFVKSLEIYNLLLSLPSPNSSTRGKLLKRFKSSLDEFIKFSKLEYEDVEFDVSQKSI